MRGKLRVQLANPNPVFVLRTLQLVNSIVMLWTLWTSVCIMPFTWIPPFKTESVAPDRLPETWASEHHRWEISSATREGLLGNEASMLVAAFHAYCMLPGRQIGSMCKMIPPQGTASHLSPMQRVAASHAGEGQLIVMEVDFQGSDVMIEPSFAVSADEDPGQSPRNSAYYNSSHFSRVPNHRVEAWEDCKWLLTLQEPDAKAEQQQEQQQQRHRLADPFLNRAHIDLRCDEVMERPSKNRRVTRPPVAESESAHSTAFGEYAKEFNILKPFLLYMAVPASAISMVNACYLDIIQAEPPSAA